MSQPFDLIILSNGPGEITTWVRPVVQAVRERLGSVPRISVILAPCTHSTGNEAEIARSYGEVDRVQSARHFWPFLLWGKTKENWQWFDRGMVLFLGGDQFFPLIVGKRLGFKTLIYAEWDARWYRFIDSFGVMNAQVLAKVPPKYHHKFSIVGDLMVDLPSESATPINLEKPVIGLLPGSKAMKLTQGVPLMVAIAEYIQTRRPDIQFILPVAPTLTLNALAQFADPAHNPVANLFSKQTAQLIHHHDQAYLETSTGLKIQLITDFPAHQYLRRCALCLTTIGGNTAELGALGIPMIILLPTQQIDAMRAWDGIPGLIANLPILGTWFAKWLNRRMTKYVLKNNVLFAWPNLWAKREIVPELVGDLTPEGVSEIIFDWLDHPEKLAQICKDLQACRGEFGAAEKFTQVIIKLMGLEK
ncbi:MAG: lipid-A-disaccharide synthase [Limnothrix sp. RL_2_0]|nr:lipid-A-disaccharide synthase [Limnothrix sp. RL_2_0]